MSSSYCLKMSDVALGACLYCWGIQPMWSWLGCIGVVPHLPMTLFAYIIPVFSLVFFKLGETKLHFRKSFFPSLLNVIFIYVLCVIIYNSFSFSLETTFANIGTFLYYFLAFFCGIFIGPLDNRKRIIYVTWLVSSIFWILFTDFHSLTIDFSKLRDIEDSAIYLSIGDGYVVLSLMAMYVQRKNIFPLLAIILISVAVLYFVNSRSSLFLYLFSVFLFLKNQSVKLMIILVLVVLVCGAYILTLVDIDILMNSRVLRLVLNTENDTSLIAREQILAEEMNHLWKNWFVGDYAGYESRGGKGTYIHNYLSFWAQYGLIPFCLLCLYLLKGAVFLFQKHESERLLNGIFAKVFFTYTVLGCFLAKGYVYSTIWLSLGVVCSCYNYYANEKNYLSSAF